MYIKTLTALALSLFIVTNAYAEGDNEVQSYLDYEKAYLNNDASKISKWLVDDFVIIETLHIPGYEPDAMKTSKQKLLQGMRGAGPSTFPRSSAETVKIEDKSEKGFCAESSTKTKTVVAGKNYLEKEIRNVCFEEGKTNWLVTKHSIDVFFEPI